MRGSSRPRDPAAKVVLLFGEDPNDIGAVRELVLALSPDSPPPLARRWPTLLMKDRQKAVSTRKNARDIAAVVQAERVRSHVVEVIAHQDCDAIEPAHLDLARRVEEALASCGIDAVACTPAWELESWWFLWPDAVVSVRPSWRRPSRVGKRVGLIKNAKEALRRDLRPRGRDHKVPDYTESDSPRIASKVRELGLIDQREARSDSFDAFATKVRLRP